MLQTTDSVKRYSSTKKRFLKGVLNNFLKREVPRLFGPILREKLVDELLEILRNNLPLKDYVEPGQIVWNVVDIRTRADSMNAKYVPVKLTIISEEDIDSLSKGVPMSVIRNSSIARITREAYEQGGLLSMRDISLFSWRTSSLISKYRKEYEENNKVVLPHTGTIQDVGSCISHKVIIIKKVEVDKQDTLQVARQTKHSIRAVERYLNDFHRVKFCYNNKKDIDFTSRATGLRKDIVKEYFDICKILC